jgi:hypothetical protein
MAGKLIFQSLTSTLPMIVEKVRYSFRSGRAITDPGMSALRQKRNERLIDYHFKLTTWATAAQQIRKMRIVILAATGNSQSGVYGSTKSQFNDPYSS